MEGNNQKEEADFYKIAFQNGEGILPINLNNKKEQIN